ncbi:hypothetical protein EW15_1415 [Prochlorococcus sp. MIT 0801]|nr:hypothetical protein EW15_1415 [Prochlorococcus sp. MIT 0801]
MQKQLLLTKEIVNLNSFENEVGLSSYDLALISIKKSQQNQIIFY